MCGAHAVLLLMCHSWSGHVLETWCMDEWGCIVVRKIHDHHHFKFLPSLPKSSLFLHLRFAIPFLLHSSFSIFKVFFLTMSSFIFDFAIGMGGRDFRGLIQQPLLDLEVISIDGSSSEDTLHGASDSDFCSLERLRVSRRTGGGTSCLHGRVQPFVASMVGQPVWSL